MTLCVVFPPFVIISPTVKQLSKSAQWTAWLRLQEQLDFDWKPSNASVFSMLGFSLRHWDSRLYDWMWGRREAQSSADGGEGICIKSALFHEGQRYTHREDPTSGLQAEWVHGSTCCWMNLNLNENILMCGLFFFPLAVHLWRIFKAVEKLGGYDSVSTRSLFDYWSQSFERCKTFQCL